MTLLRLLRPEAMVTEDRGTFKSFAKNSMQAVLARPSTGGVVRETFNASPSSPVIGFLFARGRTLTAKATVPAVSTMANIARKKLLVILSGAKNLCNLSPQAGCIDPSRQRAPLRMTTCGAESIWSRGFTYAGVLVPKIAVPTRTQVEPSSI